MSELLHPEERDALVPEVRESAMLGSRNPRVVSPTGHDAGQPQTLTAASTLEASVGRDGAVEAEEGIGESGGLDELPSRQLVGPG